MKPILFIPLAVALFAALAIAQKAVEPPESPSASQNSPPRGSRRPGTAPAPAAGGYAAATSVFSTSKGDSIPPVMIRFSESEAKSSAGLEEDLFVMARVISRTLERAEGDKVNYKLGVPMLLTGSGRSVRPMYIEGLGPLFMIKVSFPLLPPPKPEEKTARKRAADTEWVEAQRDVFATPEAWMEEPERNSNYSPERVELLQRELTGALKSAANMRGLKP